mmetsp:Transcript_25459/g.60550  ORF Transcript_25459/g.60550 Transcript_25459/m.60550 type:complete len:352 (+) Transcript_25459:901-1956(+)
MFHPMGPNRRRSSTNAWMKHKPKSSFLKTDGFVLDSNHCVSLMGSSRYALDMLALIPDGGSVTILTLFWRIVTGKAPLGMLVIHRRNSGSADSELIPSYTFSSVGIQLGAKWQFWRSTHPPKPRASEMSCAAFGPCPCPMDMTHMRSLWPLSSANLSNAAVGSLPGERTNRRGDSQDDSAKHPARSNAGGCTKSAPRTASTSVWMPRTMRSGLRHRRTQSLSNGVADSPAGPGSGSRWGSADSKTCLQGAGSTAMSLTRFRSAEPAPPAPPEEAWPRALSAESSDHIRSVIHSSSGRTSSDAAAPAPAKTPVRRKVYSSRGRSPRADIIRVVRRKENMSLSRSKRELQTLR